MEKHIEDEAWSVIYDAIRMGYEDEAIKRIMRISRISWSEAKDVLEYIREDMGMARKSSTSCAIKSGEELRNLVNEARRYPENTVTCKQCRVPYPSRLSYCPGCGVKRDSTTSVNNDFVACSSCKKMISRLASACPNCGRPTGVHVCPKCSSTNTKVITGTSKAASIFFWGAFAANKVVSKYECKNCGHKF